MATACARLQGDADLPSPSSPPLDYPGAVASIARRQASDDSIVAPSEGTILLTHGQRTDRVFVLLHGFTDSPTQFRAVGEHLFATGDNVYIPRLPHHAERRSPVRALGRVRAAELASFGDSVVEAAGGLGDSVVVVGLSAGATIAGSIAQSETGVQRVVMIAPALAAGRISDDESNTIVDVATWLPDVVRSEAPDSTRPGYVQGLSTRGLGEVLALGRLVRQVAHEKVPRVKDIIFLLNERDQTISEEAALDLAQSWIDRGARVRVYRFPRARELQHNVMEASERRGGKVGIVYPVVEALALGNPVPNTVELMPVPCSGFKCAFTRWVNGH